MSIASVTQELLVRYLDIWTPAALHTARRATFVQAWGGPPEVDAATAALRVFTEFTDRLKRRQLTVVFVAPETTRLATALDAARRAQAVPPELTIHTVTGTLDSHLSAGISAAGAAGAPLLTCVDTGRSAVDSVDSAIIKPTTSGRPAELMLLVPSGGWRGLRAALHADGFPLTAGVELVAAGEPSRLLAFGTSAGKRLEAFKDALWAVDEFAGVRYRDPRDPDGGLLDISLTPQPAPLRRELLRHLAGAGPVTVTDIRQFTLTETVYRTADTVRALTALLASGAVGRDPAHGRLSGDVRIHLTTAETGSGAPDS